MAGDSLRWEDIERDGSPLRKYRFGPRILLATWLSENRFFRGWARLTRRGAETRERLEAELGRPATEDEFNRAMAEEFGYDLPLPE